MKHSVLRANKRAASLPALSAGFPIPWGMRRLVTNYNGPLFRLVRISDSATMLVYASSPTNNAPNVADVPAFLGAAVQCRVDTVYAQDYSGLNLTQTTASLMPFFTMSPLTTQKGKYGVTFDGNQNNAYFNIPSGVTGSGQSVTFVNIASPESLGNNNTVGMLGATYTTAGSLSVLLSASNAGDARINVLTSTTFLANDLGKTRSQIQVTAVASGASNIHVYQDTHGFALPVNNAGTFAGGTIGKGANSLQFFGEWYGALVYPGKITAGDFKVLTAYLHNRFDVVISPVAKLLMPGNSIVQGAKATLNQNNPRQAEPLFNKPVWVVDNAIFGQTAATQYANRAFYSVQFDAAIPVNILHAPEATNDIDGAASGNIANYNSSGLDIGTYAWNTWVLPFIQAMNAAGYAYSNILVPTILDRGWVGSSTDISQKAAARTAYNNLVASAQATYGFRTVDYAAIPNMANSSNTTYYADLIHPTSAGYGLLAIVLAAAVNAILATVTLPTSALVPTDISNLALWLDAADGSSITSSSGGVSQWNDKSGNARHAQQATSANQPVTGTRTINGKNAIDFIPGNSTVLNLASAIPAGTAYTAFVVFTGDTASLTNPLVGSTGNGGFALRTDTSGLFVIVKPGTAVLKASFEAVTAGVPCIGVARSKTAGNQVYINGIYNGNNANNPGYTGTIDTIGYVSSAYLDGGVGEVIIYTADLNAFQVNCIGNYLSNKWGIPWMQV